MRNIIEVKNLTYKTNKKTIFNNFNISIPEGSYTTITGNNDSGKTALIRLINGLLPSDNSIVVGMSYINSKRINDHSKEIGSVYGNKLDSFLFDDVYKEMAFPLENLSIEPAKIEERIIEIAKFFDISELLDKKVVDLTSLEKQEVLLAIALLHEPKVLLLDNPFSMMDRATKNKIESKLLKYKEKNNLTIILATNNLEEVLRSDYLYVLDNGEIVIEGKPLSVLKEEKIINRLGLTMPFMVDLSLKLKDYELIDDIELDMEALVNKLWK